MIVERALAVSDLTVRLRAAGGWVYAVDRVSFDLFKGEVLAIVGESGCGKSMTAMAVLGLLPPPAEVTSGTIEFRGLDLLALPAAQLRRLRGKAISVVFQEPMSSLNPAFKVGWQVSEVLRHHEGLSRKQARARTIELFSTVRIPDPARRFDNYPHELSGGMQQRVMIAMALACQPDVLVADEPTTALDVTIQAETLAVIRDLRERLDMSIVLITHDLGVVADLADRVAVMYAGRKVEEAVTRELFAHPQHPYTRALLGALPRPGRGAPQLAGRRLAEIPGTVPTVRAPADHCSFSTRCVRVGDVCRSTRPELEAVRPGHLVACFYPGEDG